MQQHTQTIVAVCILSAALACCHGYAFQPRDEPPYSLNDRHSMILWMTDCECDCPEVNTVHENIKRSGNSSTLLLSVTQPCRDSNIEMNDFDVSIDDSGLLIVAANISEGDKIAISRQYQVPPIADIDLISAKYTEEHILQVTIPYRRKSSIKRRNIDVVLPHYPKPNTADAHQEPPVDHTPAEPNDISSIENSQKAPGSGSKLSSAQGNTAAGSKAVQVLAVKAIQIFDAEKPVKTHVPGDSAKVEDETTVEENVELLKTKLADEVRRAVKNSEKPLPPQDVSALKRQVALLEEQLRQLQMAFFLEQDV